MEILDQLKEIVGERRQALFVRDVVMHQMLLKLKVFETTWFGR